MKVVLFCGGLGMRLREYSDAIPKPMVPVGPRPILWHVMKYYAHFGHNEFILCLGYKGETIKQYFLKYSECLSNDFVLSSGGTEVRLFNSDISDWTITFVDTGIHANIGQRLMAVRPYLNDEEVFLANYSDGLSDLHLPHLIDFFRQRDSLASFMSVRPRQSLHAVQMGSEGQVQAIEPVSRSDLWINGGYFVLRREIFDFMRPGEELVEEPFHRLIRHGRLHTMRYEGFWGCMDTYKEKQTLDDMITRGETPWQVWRKPAASGNGATRLPVAEIGLGN
jgi:glucose-1-phosphate cytidylyltransferase